MLKMALKKHKSKKNKSNEMLSIAVVAEKFEHNFEPAEMNLIRDLDANFFSVSDELIRELVLADQIFVASKLKCYVNLLARLHGKYVEEVDRNKIIREKIKDADEKLRLALETTSISQEVIDHFRESFAEAWRVSDAALVREGMLEKKMNRKIEVKCLDRNQEDDLGNLAEYRTAILRNRDRLSNEVMDYKKRLQAHRYYSYSLEDLIALQNEHATEQAERIRSLEFKMSDISRKLRRIEETFLDEKRAHERELNACQAHLKDFDDSKKRLAKLEKQNELQRLAIESYRRDNNTLKINITQLTANRDELKKTLKILNEELISEKVESENWRGHYKKLEQDYKKITDTLESVKHRLGLSGRKVAELNDIIILEKNKETGLTKKLHDAVGKFNEMTRFRDEMMRSRDKAQLDIVHLNDVIRDLKHTEILLRNEIQNLHWVEEKCNNKLNEKDNQIHKMSKDYYKVVTEMNELGDNNERLVEQVELKTNRITILSEQLQSEHLAYLSVKKQLESLHTEKITMERSLELSARDKQSLQNINTKLSHQVDQLTNVIAINEKDIFQLNIQTEQLKNVVKTKQTEIITIGSLLRSNRDELKEMKHLNDQAQKTIAEDEKRFIKMNIDLEQLRKEKSLVGTQMVRRNDELVVARDRVNIMQTALDNGNTQYNQRIEDIQLLKQEIKNLRLSNECLFRAAMSTADMRQQLIRMDRQLNHERLRVAAYTEEFQRPCRIHYWRVVRCKNPQTYDLLTKIQLLLKRNLKLSNIKANMELEIKEMRLKYKKVCERLKIMADPTIKLRLNTQENINRKQIRKIKAMKAELAINEIDLKTHECLIDGYQNALQKSNQLCKQASDVSYETLMDTLNTAYAFPTPSVVVRNRDDEKSLISGLSGSINVKLRKDLYEKIYRSSMALSPNVGLFKTIE